MQNIDESYIKHIASLSKIDLKDEEVPVISSQIDQFLKYVEQLSDIPENIEPLDNLTKITNRLREDEVIDFGNKEKIISNTPCNKDNFILVPKVLDN